MITLYDDQERASSVDFRRVELDWAATVAERFRDVDRVGIIAPTSLAGIGFWKAVLVAGKTPILLQYPTPKLSRVYWLREIHQAIDTLGVEGLGYWSRHADPEVDLARVDLSRPARVDQTSPSIAFAEGRLAQLSSGTTGFRKGIALRMADVIAHVEAYNQTLQLGAEDCIVSWLPLYHDMGFIAAFLMPLILGIRAVMVDPITWVRRPELILDLIERHRGTVCYMPNFGFEVLARHARRQYDLGAMRRWVSCSEPTRLGTVEHFLEATRASPDTVSNCYAMAENIFAVTQSVGLSARDFAGSSVVSCGAPIPGVDVKVVEGEVWVRSAYSLRNYEGGASITDAEGYYPTGDVGELIDGQLYILGRTRDVMIHAGRKIVLSDVDYLAGQLLPSNAGRIATVPAYNALLGTDEPVCLIEDPKYWARNRESDLRARLKAEAGLDPGQLEFIAPGFVTKTSSGKINRRLTSEHWVALDQSRKRRRRARADQRQALFEELGQHFVGLDRELPLDEQLDSLGLVNVELMMREFGVDAPTSKSLREIEQLSLGDDNGPTAPVLNVVSLFDADRMLALMPPVLTALGQALGVSIHYEHVCCPPAPILLSDLAFEDQFMIRDPRAGVYDGLSSSLEALRQADLVIADDMVQLAWPAVYSTHYPRLNERFQGDPNSECLCLRWARYSDRNHLIATSLVASVDIKPELANEALDDLEAYLGVPVVRVALTKQFAAHTAHWQVRHLEACASALILRAAETQLDNQRLAEQVFAGLVDASKRARRQQGPAGRRWHMSDQQHWCSWLVAREAIDFVLDRYDSFLVLGKRASIPYLSNEAARRGKMLTFRSDLECPSGDYDCVLQTGSWGRPVTDKPVFPLMIAGWDGPANVSAQIAAAAPLQSANPIRSGRVKPL
jgi:acyl-CoA synthetase (AMP-forming)/AMP-acid ligase II